jgi:AcrR family transcriptional regulator
VESVAGRPRSFDRDAALAVAVEQFWRSGYAETSIASLTAAMGVTPPSLYAAFGDKQRLFAEASEAYAARTFAAVDRAAGQPTARETVEQVLVDTAHAHAAPGTPPGCLMMTEPRLAGQREVVRRMLVDRLERGVRDGDLPAGTDAEGLATFLMAVLRGMSALARDGGTLDDLLGIARTALVVVPETRSTGSAARQP